MHLKAFLRLRSPAAPSSLQGDRLLHRGRPDLALQTGLRGRKAESEEGLQVHSTRLSTRFPADIAAFTGSAAAPLTLVCKACGCFNDASTWSPFGRAGAAGMRSHKKWRYAPEPSFNALSELPRRFLQLPPPRLAFLVCVRRPDSLAFYAVGPAGSRVSLENAS